MSDDLGGVFIDLGKVMHSSGCRFRRSAAQYRRINFAASLIAISHILTGCTVIESILMRWEARSFGKGSPELPQMPGVNQCGVQSIQPA